MNWSSKISVYNKDCMELMNNYTDNYFNLAIVDVPYGIGEDGRKTKGRTFRKDGTARKSVDSRNGRKSVIFNTYKIGNWDNEYPEQSYFDELFRVSEKQIIWGCNYIQFNQKNTSTGRVFWDKVNGTNDFSDGEIAWTNCMSSVRQIEFMWNGMLQGKSYVSGRTNQGNKKKCEKRIHPTQKPVQLYLWLLDNFAKENDKIIDTHFGSGSIALACERLGFKLVAAEKDKDYYQNSYKRFKEETSQMSLFPSFV